MEKKYNLVLLLLSVCVCLFFTHDICGHARYTVRMHARVPLGRIGNNNDNNNNENLLCYNLIVIKNACSQPEIPNQALKTIYHFLKFFNLS